MIQIPRFHEETGIKFLSNTYSNHNLSPFRGINCSIIQMQWEDKIFMVLLSIFTTGNTNVQIIEVNIFTPFQAAKEAEMGTLTPALGFTWSEWDFNKGKKKDRPPKGTHTEPPLIWPQCALNAQHDEYQTIWELHNASQDLPTGVHILTHQYRLVLISYQNQHTHPHSPPLTPTKEKWKKEKKEKKEKKVFLKDTGRSLWITQTHHG